MGKTVTSIKVDEDVWKKVKIEAIQLDMELSKILEEALQNWLRSKEKKK